MRLFWLCIALLAIGSLALLWSRRAPGTPAETGEVSLTVEPAPTIEAPADAGAAALAAELLASAEEREAEPEPPAAEFGGSPVAPSSALEPGPSAPEPSSSFPLENTVPVVVKPQDDGSVLLDDRFVLRGRGTEDDPYLITWDLLISASETYTPRLGLLKLPQRITMLHDHYVRITGYVAFPPGAAEARELLAMMNMWDGCCIGVPPSPYDALEVKLREPIQPTRQHFSPFATVQGKLRVDPYLIENWLVGLYLLEDAMVNMEL